MGFGLELVYLLLDYFEYTNDEEFLSEYVLPTSNEIIAFLIISTKPKMANW